MPTKTEIANKALSRLGQGVTIQNVDTDQSVEAGYVRTFYEPARQEILRQHTWGFAKGFRELVQTANKPNSNFYSFQFKFPNDVLRIVEIERSVSNSGPEKFERAYDHRSGDPVILTTVESPVAIVTEDIRSEKLFDPMFADALAYRIAVDIAPLVTSDTSKQELMVQFMQRAIEQAKAVSSEEGEQRDRPEADWIRSR